ncbi:BIG/ATPase V1 complex, subunit S1 [Rhypophila decipiens]|uniref:Protein BIG1 n=1 Tax=Rhypophila decipiens TaxID=261697 RepID=A0AAN6Y8N4_9PEZI|nr:BIG/ATPase V1 complex, subunit S1 [Rhypophila decipiens]
MQLSLKAALLAAAYTSSSVVSAFSDSSPFILLSTAELKATANHLDQLQTSTQIIEAAKDVLSSCPTEKYLIVSVPNLHAADVRDATDFKMPILKRAMGEKKLHDGLSVAEVVGQVSTGPLVDYIEATCLKTAGKKVNVELVELKHLPSLGGKDSEKRGEVLGDNDREIGRLLDNMDADFSVIILSDPNEFKAYEPDFVAPMHMDLKRMLEPDTIVGRAAEKNSTKRDTRPLFEKYQFFTPGVFMSLVVLIILLSILYAGLSALGSLQVSYGAFDKEMGPAAQKKNM